MSDGISREYSTSPWGIHYARMDGSDMFFTFDPSKTNAIATGTAAPVNRLLNLFHRNVVHITSKKLVVVYDRMNAYSQYRASGSVAECRFIAPQIETLISGTKYKVDTSNKRRFRDVVDVSPPNPVWATENLQTLYGSASFASVTKLRLDINSGDAWIMNLFEATTTSTPNMIQHEPACSLPSTYGFRSMRGVTITTANPTSTHILFSINIDGSTPSAVIDYHVTKAGATDKHFVVDLAPNQTYLVTETALSGAVNRYVLTPTASVRLKTNSAGVLEFTPDDLASQTLTIPPIDIDDLNPGAGSDETVVYGTPYTVIELNDFPPDKPSPPPGAPTPAVGSDDSTSSFTKIAVGVTAQVVDIDDVNNASDGSADSITTANNKIIDIDDTASAQDDVTMEVTNIYLPPSAHRHKVIKPRSLNLLPNSDNGSNFVATTPGDGIMFTKINDDADDTYLSFQSPFNIPASAFMPAAYAMVGLEDPSYFARTIHTIQFVVRLGPVAGNMVTPILAVKLRDSPVYQSGTVKAQWNIPLPLFEDTAQQFQSTNIDINVTGEEFNSLYMSFEPRATTYNTDYRVRIVKGYVKVVTYTGREKVIR